MATRIGTLDLTSRCLSRIQYKGPSYTERRAPNTASILRMMKTTANYCWNDLP